MTEANSSIIDNREGNTLLNNLEKMGRGGRNLDIAAAFFSLDGLLLLADILQDYEHIRILFGDDASALQRKKLFELLRLRSDSDLLSQREKEPLLSDLQKVKKLFEKGRVEARCYTSKKFHAKAYVIERPEIFPSLMGVIGSGNFTRPGLLQNVELNVQLTPEQTSQLQEWYQERWDEASDNIVTEDLLKEIRRQLDFYEPYMLYLKALYLWGQDRQETEKITRSTVIPTLDKHQMDGYLQALSIIERQNGVMICDGVGLGKSYIALALMEHFCQEGRNILLIAPKNILINSWYGYLSEYMHRYQNPFGNIHTTAMTSLGFPHEDLDELMGDGGSPDQALNKNQELLTSLYERADVVVIDESHNFRKRSCNRYQNLYDLLKPYNGKLKKVILLTATPLNTAYEDLSSQIALITNDEGCIGAYSIEQIRKATAELDREKLHLEPAGQLSLFTQETPNRTLNKVLEQLVIQRSRTTCKELSRAAGKILSFPKRKDPVCIRYTISDESRGYRELIDLAEKRFRPGVKYIEKVQKELERVRTERENAGPLKLPKYPERGIKLAAYLIEQYRWTPETGSKVYHDEVHLAELVYSNTLKQLESSPAAFQGIIQSIGLGLIARLKHIFGEEVNSVIESHLDWVRSSIFSQNKDTEGDENNNNEDILEDGDNLDASGEEVDGWLEHAIRTRNLQKKLAEFVAEKYDIERWKSDIISDLKFLKEIHEAILKARKQPDSKLQNILPVIQKELTAGKKVLVFTQSLQTARYLENEIHTRLSGIPAARIDSKVNNESRQAILHAFCPGYNAAPLSGKWPPSIPREIDLLISTDVLSEGVNLQETGAILNYDIHWNPVRLIQRIGRVDRRLDPNITPEEHEFAIYNVFPPKEIEAIIGLVNSVERRTLKISEALGIDESFFKADDPAGTLREFNKQYEGEMTSIDKVSTQYIRVFDKPDPKLIEKLEAIPAGAFGVWKDAPDNGIFALFQMKAKNSASEEDINHFRQILGRPILALKLDGRDVNLDAGNILNMLSKTVKGQSSGNPSDEASLSKNLCQLKNYVRGQFAEIELPSSIYPELICWMELQKGVHK